MNIIFKFDEKLLTNIHADLSRSHELAFERVGFVECRAAATESGIMILATAYHPVADSNYLPSKKIGALINASAIREALQISMQNKSGMFHIHRHEHSGTPNFSHVDKSGNSQLIPDFFKVSPKMPHGAIVLSRNSMIGECWINNKQSESINRFEVVGKHLNILKATI